MTRAHHIDRGSLELAPGVRLARHCLVVEDARGLALVEAGTGLQDVERSAERLGWTLMEMFGYHDPQELPRDGAQEIAAPALRPAPLSR